MEPACEYVHSKHYICISNITYTPLCLHGIIVGKERYSDIEANPKKSRMKSWQNARMLLFAATNVSRSVRPYFVRFNCRRRTIAIFCWATKRMSYGAHIMTKEWSKQVSERVWICVLCYFCWFVRLQPAGRRYHDSSIHLSHFTFVSRLSESFFSLLPTDALHSTGLSLLLQHFVYLFVKHYVGYFRSESFDAATAIGGRLVDVGIYPMLISIYKFDYVRHMFSEIT